MPIHRRYFDQQDTPNSVSSHRSPDENGFVDVVFQSGRPPIDFEFQLFQEIRKRINDQINRNRFPSGFIVNGRVDKDVVDYSFVTDPADPAFEPNVFWMKRQEAIVAGMPVVIDYTESATGNKIELDPPPVFGGPAPDLKRTDFVFLEAWLSLVSPSPRAYATIEVASLPNPGDTLDIGLNTLTAVVGAPGVDEFEIGLNEIITASNIKNSINNPANSFIADVYATSINDVVRVISQEPGVAGNAITISSSDPLVLVPSGANLTGGEDRPNKPDQSHVYRFGNTLSDPSMNLDDDIMDNTISFETAQRVQVQYRIRKTGQSEAVNFKTETHGFDNASVLAAGGTGSPIASYFFVPADNTTVIGSSSAVEYGYIDPGLWIAGDGSSTSANDLQTLDGFVYAIPIAFVFRKNDAYVGGAGSGFDPKDNANGGLTTGHGPFLNPYVGAINAGDSDRPDGEYPDAIHRSDVMDLRRHIHLNDVNYLSELQWQLKCLLNNNLRTWAIDTADEYELGNGTGNVSTTNLICDEIGRSTALGGNDNTSGTTPRGNFRSNFDHVCRRFGSQSVVERLLIPVSKVSPINPGISVSTSLPGSSGWYEGDVININLSLLNISTDGSFDIATATLLAPPNSFASFSPVNTYVTDVLSAYHDDGHFTTPVDRNLKMNAVVGLCSNTILITIAGNDSVVNGGVDGDPDYQLVGDAMAGDVGSQRNIFIELEVTYPLGNGISETPVVQLSPNLSSYPSGPVLENDNTQRPSDFDSLIQPKFRPGKREVAIEYSCNSFTETLVSNGPLSITTSRRMWEGQTATYQDLSLGGPVLNASPTTRYGSSDRLLATSAPLSGNQTLCSVTYKPQDAVPNFGAVGGGYQLSVYYRTAAPQTAGAKSGPLVGAGGTLPMTLVVEILSTSDEIWSGQSSVGTVTNLSPYDSPLEQIPDVLQLFGEYELCSLATINMNNVGLNSGLLNLHSLMPIDESGQALVSAPNIDIEFRVYYSSMNMSSESFNFNGMVPHKNFVPFLAKVKEDGAMFRRGDIVLMLAVQSRVDDKNKVSDEPGSCFAVYRTKNLLISSEN